MIDFKQIRKLSIYFEINIMRIDTLSLWGFMGFFGELIHQNLGANFGAPKSSYRSQKQPVLSPGDINGLCLAKEFNSCFFLGCFLAAVNPLLIWLIIINCNRCENEYEKTG